MKTQEEKLTLEQVNNLPKVETLSKKLYELTEEELAQVTGGKEYTLTDEMIKQGEYAVGQADVIIYNEEKYYDQHQCTNIDRIDMFIYKSSTGAVLLIPFDNYS